MRPYNLLHRSEHHNCCVYSTIRMIRSTAGRSAAADRPCPTILGTKRQRLLLQLRYRLKHADRSTRRSAPIADDRQADQQHQRDKQRVSHSNPRPRSGVMRQHSFALSRLPRARRSCSTAIARSTSCPNRPANTNNINLNGRLISRPAAASSSPSLMRIDRDSPCRSPGTAGRSEIRSGTRPSAR